MTLLSRRCSVLLLAFAQFCCAASTIRGSSLVQNQLQGVAGVQVVAYVKPWDGARSADALAAHLRAATVEQLQRAAINDQGVALLSIQVDAERSTLCDSAIAVNVSIDLRAKVRLSHTEGDETIYDATTWSRRVLVITQAGHATEQIEKTVKEFVEIFIADVQEANKR